MTKRGVANVAVGLICLVATADIHLAQRAVKPQSVVNTSTLSPDAEAALVQQYCVACHNAAKKSGSLDLSAVNFQQLDKHAELAEKMIRKLRAGMMPPPGAQRPRPNVINDFAGSLQSQIDRYAPITPNL